jgi:hypothetical protein
MTINYCQYPRAGKIIAFNPSVKGQNFFALFIKQYEHSIIEFVRSHSITF